MSSIKKRLREDAKQLLPDEKLKSSTKRAVFGAGDAPSNKEAKERRRAPMMRTITAVACCAVVIISVTMGLVFGLYAPSKNGGKGGGLDYDSPVLAEVSDLMAFSIVSTSGLISDLSPNSGEISAMSAAVCAQSPSLVGSVLSDGSEEFTEEEKDLIKQQISMLENMIDGSSKTTSHIASDRDGYAYCFKVSAVSILGKAEEYLLYYNQKYLGNNRGEEMFTIDGVMVVSADGEMREYPVSGKRTVESEYEDGENETEVELTFTVYINKSNGEYIQFKQEVEREGAEYEEEFIYSYYKNNKRVETVTVEREAESDEHELKIITDKGGVRTEIDYEEELDENLNPVITAKIASGNVVKTVKITVVEIDGEKHYEYSWEKE